MDDLQDLSFQDLMQKMGKLQEIEFRWRENKNIEEVRREIHNLNLSDLDFLTKDEDDPKKVMMILRLFYYKFFAVLNVRIKDMVMSYKDDPSKLQDLQMEMQKIFNIDFSKMDLMNPFSFMENNDDFSDDKEMDDKSEENKNSNNKSRTLN